MIERPSQHRDDALRLVRIAEKAEASLCNPQSYLDLRSARRREANAFGSAGRIGYRMPRSSVIRVRMRLLESITTDRTGPQISR